MGSTDWLRKGSLWWGSGEDLVSSLWHSTKRTTVVHICSLPAGQKTGTAFLPLKEQPRVLTLHISLELICEHKDLCDSESMNPRLFRILAPGLFHAIHHRLPLTGKACIHPQQNTSKMESLEFRTFKFQDLIFFFFLKKRHLRKPFLYLTKQQDPCTSSHLLILYSGTQKLSERNVPCKVTKTFVRGWGTRQSKRLL